MALRRTVGEEVTCLFHLLGQRESLLIYTLLLMTQILCSQICALCCVSTISTYQLTRQIEGFVYHILLSKANVTEVLFALPDSNDFSTLLEYFHNDLFCPIFRQATHKYCLTSWWSLSCCRWWEI